MLLPPATPLSVLLLVAFILLLLSVLSTPVIKSIPLASYEGVDFGVFGYCKGKDCSGIRVGYSSDGLFDDHDKNPDFNLSASARHSLSSLLIVHPVAALLTLICFGLAAAAHLRSPSHSPRYLLGLLILLLPTLLISLLAFLVDILIFVPHLKWGGWIVLVATILLTSSGVVTCAMRRTLVSRKARKRRIAENAEMSGENFYNRQNAIKLDSPSPVVLEREDSAPPVIPNADSLPAFASFEPNARSADDDRRPLNSGTPPNISIDTGLGRHSPDDRRDRFGPPGPGGRAYNSPTDEYGNLLPPSATFGPPPNMRGVPSDPRLRNQYSNGNMGSQSGGAGFGGRGRGGFSTRGRGAPYAGPRGAPPQVYNGGGREALMGPTGPAGPVRAMTGRGRGLPPGSLPQGQSLPGGGYGTYGPRPLNATGNAGPDALREHDPDVQGMVSLQQNPQVVPARIQSSSSTYSSQESYVPPRSGWAGAHDREPTLPNVKLPATEPPPANPPGSDSNPRELNRFLRPSRSRSDERYQEDVDSRFADLTPGSSDNLPAALTSGLHTNRYRNVM